MAPVCPLCRAEVMGDGTLLKAGRRPLAVVHKHCAAAAQRGVALIGKLALMGTAHVLAARAPGLMAAITATQQLLQRREVRQ